MPHVRRYGLSPAEWASARETMHHTLIEVARERRTITYGDLARVATGGRLSARSGGLMALLDEACSAEESGRGLVLASVVVRQDTGVPGDGYFAWFAAAGRDVSDRFGLWGTEVSRVYDAYTADQGVAT